jgi:integrase
MTWTPQHHKAVEYTLLNFVSWRGQGTTGQLGTITKQVIRDYREAAQKALAPKTVNNHLAIISSFFSWAIDQGVCSLNPAKDLALKVKTRRSSQRKAFSGQQIQEVMGTISASVWYTKKLRDWIPLIMLYTGARPEEIAQLRRKDIRMAGDWDNGSRLWLFDFETEENGQRRKSEASRRLVPVHPKLIERGLINLLQGTEGSPDSLIWPQEGGNERGRLSENASRWFNRTWLRSHCGITDPKLVLYSIRHSVATRLKHRGVDECMIAQLLGHEHPEITNGRYGKDYPIKQLAEALTHLEWFV